MDGLRRGPGWAGFRHETYGLLFLALSWDMPVQPSTGRRMETRAATARRVVGEGIERAPVVRARADSGIVFRLSDQFGRVHQAAEYRGRALIIVAAGRGGSPAATEWVKALRQLQDTAGPTAPVPIVAVADLRGVPRLLRRFVRRRFPDDRNAAVLLDWEGGVAGRFGFDPGQCTILLVDPTGLPGSRSTPTSVDSVLARTLLREATEVALRG